MRILLSLVLAAGSFAQTSSPLLQQPTLSKTHIVFAYAGDLWSVSREGGGAVRLTTGTGIENHPYFSPDGSKVAFTGEYDGNVDVYVIPSAGGVPKRLTYHPDADISTGWTPDGSKILIRSGRLSFSRYQRLFTVPSDGGFPTVIDLPAAHSGSFSQDASKIAYLPVLPAFAAWKRYRGGQTTPIWIANLADARVEKLPRENSNDFSPMWIGGRIYFLSDRSGPVTLYSYDTNTRRIVQAVRNQGLDLKWAQAGPGAIVYEQFGTIHLFDPNSGQSRKVEIRIAGDLPSVRPSFQKVSARITNASISPTGSRALFEARGEVFTVPAEKGDIRNLTNTTAIADRGPSWSPDGKRIAYFSDASGEYQLHLRAQNGMSDVERVDLGKPSAFYYRPMWSPDSKKIAYTDNRLGLSFIDLEKKSPVLIDKDTYQTPFQNLNPNWSPDSKWIVYTKLLKNHLRAVYLYSVESGKTHQVSDGMSSAEHAVFDKSAKHLYFMASTNQGLATAWLDMSSMERPTTSSVYVVVLSKDDPSPLAPESDEEKAEEPKKPEEPKDKDKEKETKAVRIDLDAIGQRILALPMPARDYVFLQTGKEGTLFVGERIPVVGPGPDTVTVHKFELKTRKAEKLIDGVRAFDVSFNGDKMLFRQGDRWAIQPTTAPKPAEGTLKLDAMEVMVDPQQEWKQIYKEVWRIQRDFFYDANHHGLDLQAASERYEKYLNGVAHRQDLTYLFAEMLGELSVGHLYVGGGALPDVKRVPGGLLGADYTIENGRYRFARVFDGENWNPDLKAPLTQPGVNVKVGEYLLAVNGRDLRATDNVYQAFESTSGKSVTIKVGADPSGAGARDVVVVPVASETALRHLAWIEGNRRKVDQLSGGRVAYVYLPNTAGGGYTNFNRYYFAQLGREGAVIDERFNGGGLVADYIVDYLKRPLTNFFTTRYGDDFTTPQNAIFGPKVMIINEYAGSGGDALPWLFRQQGVGKLVGKRTWGGLIGIFGFPQLIDGGFVTAPNLAFYSPKGEWEVENAGVPPDIEVEMDPVEVRAGRDPQLEKAVELVLEDLKKKPLPTYKKPAYPNYHRTRTPATGGAQ